MPNIENDLYNLYTSEKVYQHGSHFYKIKPSENMLARNHYAGNTPIHCYNKPVCKSWWSNFDELHAFLFISNTFISNARLKLADFENLFRKIMRFMP